MARIAPPALSGKQAGSTLKRKLDLKDSIDVKQLNVGICHADPEALVRGEHELEHGVARAEEAAALHRLEVRCENVLVSACHKTRTTDTADKTRQRRCASALCDLAYSPSRVAASMRAQSDDQHKNTPKRTARLLEGQHGHASTHNHTKHNDSTDGSQRC
jgi:hypothetical protein